MQSRKPGQNPGEGRAPRALREARAESRVGNYDADIGLLDDLLSLDPHYPNAASLLAQLRSLAEAPDEVRVEFGLDLHAQAGAFIAAASTTANFTVGLTWRREGKG
jgi:hypothetical protein